MTLMPPSEPEAQVTRVYERHGCLYVEGVVMTPQGVLRSRFTIPQKEVVERYPNREAFYEFCRRTLPQTTEDKKWSPTGEVLV